MNSKILVTGARGFIGGHLRKFLQSRNCDVVAFDCKTDVWSEDVYKKELEQILDTPEIKAIAHLGAIATTHNVKKDNLFGFNTHAVRIMGEFCEQIGIPLVFVSSSAIYANGDDNLSLYALSKRNAEIELLGLKKLSFTCLRLFNTYGFNETSKGPMKSVISDMILSALQFKSLGVMKLASIGFGEQSRDFIFVEDVCKIIFEVIQKSMFENKIYDLGTGISYKFSQIANELVNLLPGTIIEAKYLPEGYNPSTYQTHTKANMDWLRRLNRDIELSTPSENIPTLIKQYADALSF
jgi:ADP-L-glycero-D-manno-heptose 6-epimerase